MGQAAPQLRAPRLLLRQLAAQGGVDEGQAAQAAQPAQGLHACEGLWAGVRRLEEVRVVVRGARGGQGVGERMRPCVGWQGPWGQPGLLPHSTLTLISPQRQACCAAAHASTTIPQMVPPFAPTCSLRQSSRPPSSPAAHSRRLLSTGRASRVGVS